MSRPPLDSAPIGTNTTSVTMPQLDLIPIGKKIKNPRYEHNQRSLQHYQLSHQHDQRNLQREREKRTYQRTRSYTHHCQTHHRVNLICQITAITENPKAINVIKIKSVGNTRNKTRQNHHQAITILLIIVTIDLIYAKIRRATEKRIPSNYVQS